MDNSRCDRVCVDPMLNTVFLWVTQTAICLMTPKKKLGGRLLVTVYINIKRWIGMQELSLR